MLRYQTEFYSPRDDSLAKKHIHTVGLGNRVGLERTMDQEDSLLELWSFGGLPAHHSPHPSSPQDGGCIPGVIFCLKLL